MGEKASYNAMRKGIMQRRDRIDRVENIVVDGMPDVSMCLVGIGDVWIEDKSPREPKRPTTRLFGSNHRLSVQQINWLLVQKQAGGRCFVFIDTDKRRLLIDGKHADSINEMTVAELIEISVFHSPKPMDKKEWARFRKSLA